MTVQSIMTTDPAPPLTHTDNGSAMPKRALITLARHGEPALDRNIRLRAKDYLDWWARYEESGLLAGQTPPADLVTLAQQADIIMTSTRPRAIQTARAVCAERSFSSHELFIEAPLPPPPFPDMVMASPRIWGFLSRCWWWFFNHHGGQETRAEARLRAKAAARHLTERADQGQDVLVLAHGFFNAMIGIELKRLGWKSVLDQGYDYWSQKRYQRP
jgi:broad specificity phosphatase PhoE